MQLPRNQKEWRALSSAMRKQRREYAAARRFRTIKAGADWDRYLFCDYGPVRCYNGESPASLLPYLHGAIAKRRAGLRDRSIDVAGWLRASRARGPLPLPA